MPAIADQGNNWDEKIEEMIAKGEDLPVSLKLLNTVVVELEYVEIAALIKFDMN